MSSPRAVERCIREVERAARRGVDHEGLRQLAADTLGRTIPFDAACWATLDPVTLMWTNCLLVGLERDSALEVRLFQAEYAEDDVAKFSELVRAGRATAILSAETGGDLPRSSRYRFGFAGMGVSDELRVSFAGKETAWGSLQLLRTGGRRFTDEEAAVLQPLSRPLAGALRHSLLRAATEHPRLVEGTPPGLLLLRTDGSVDEVSPEAERLLGGRDLDGIATALRGLCVRTRADQGATATVNGAHGNLVTVHGTLLGARVAVIVEPVRPFELARVVTNALGLTDRERDIVARVARGMSTKEISIASGIGEWTIQDHLKSIFAKVGVNSRQALVAALFFGYWSPEHERHSAPSPFGHFLHNARAPARKP